MRGYREEPVERALRWFYAACERERRREPRRRFAIWSRDEPRGLHLVQASRSTHMTPTGCRYRRYVRMRGRIRGER